MEELPEDVEALRKLVKQLLENHARVMEENAMLKAQVLELRRRLAMDSTNSSQAPSRDGYKKKTIKAAIAKPSKASGGQKGHRGHTLERVATADPVHVHRPECCGGCGQVFTPEDA